MVIKLFLAALTFFSIENLTAQTLKVTTNPTRPEKNTPFDLVFNITTDTEVLPQFEFIATGLELGDVSLASTQHAQTFINGVISSSTTYSYRYPAEAKKSGNYFIKGIKVIIGNQTLTHPDVRVTVLDAPERPKLLDVVVEVDKTYAYVGEQILATYYLYSQVDATDIDVISFPTLQNFVKSYANVPSAQHNKVETVERNGQMYYRRIFYHAKLFPEKSGKLLIDPLKVKVSFVSGMQGFSGFSFGNRVVTQQLSSSPTFVEVANIPAKGVPPTFSGLVGVHTFDLSLNKNKFLVNEPIELKLTVEGKGALENWSAPTLYQHDLLESFEVSSDIQVDPYAPNKKFLTYTYLPRGPFLQSEKNITISYFDPQTSEFESVSFTLPGLEILDSGSTSPAQNNSQSIISQDKNAEVVSSQIKPIELAIMAPILNYDFSDKLPSAKIFMYVVLLLTLLIFIYFVTLLVGGENVDPYADLMRKELSLIQKNGLNYQRLFHMIELCRKRGNLPSTLTSREVIEQTVQDKNAREYFYHLLKEVEEHGFQQEYSKNSVSFVAKYFKTLFKVKISQKI